MIALQFDKCLHGANGAFTLEVALEVAAGEFVALYGPSGAGKTTLLRCLAGLDRPDAGRISAGGEVWYQEDRRIDLQPQKRCVGYMFQDYALFPNMTVRGNLEFALRKGGDRRRIDELLDMMELGELQYRKPDALSGGQQQRVALARALASDPRLLLLDEPLSALDPATRVRLQDEILAMQRRYGLTTLMVSHDVGEVYKLAGRVAVLEHGKVARIGSPAAIFGAGEEGGKFRFSGEVLAIEEADVVFAVSVLVGHQIVRVIATREEAVNLRPADKVMLVSKAFSPTLLKLAS